MDYLGRILSITKDFYNGINPATLTGAVDVIVVEQPDGSYLCSPFHVRFGKLGVLRSRQKVVDIEINGIPIDDLHMKLGDAGEAFFVEEADTQVPSFLATSPINSAADLMEQGLAAAKSEEAADEDYATQGNMKRNENDVVDSGSEEPIREALEIVYSGSEDPTYSSISSAIPIPSRNNEWISVESSGRDLFSDGDISPAGSSPVDCTLDHHTTPYSDTEIELKQSSTSYDDFEEDWNWDDIEKAKTKESTDGSPSLISSMMKFIRRKELPQSNSTTVLDGGIYLSELSNPDMNPEVAAKYLRTKREIRGRKSEGNLLLENEKGRGVVKSTKLSAEDSLVSKHSRHFRRFSRDVNPEFEEACKNYSNIAISECGRVPLADDSRPSQEKFETSILAFDNFCANPGRLFDQETVIRIGDNYYPWQVAVPMVMSLVLYQQPLPQVVIDRLIEEHVHDNQTPKSTIGSWFSWRSQSNVKNAKANIPKGVSMGDLASDEGTDDESVGNNNVNINEKEKTFDNNQATGEDVESFCAENYKKALRLSSEQLKSLNLEKGGNTITYSVTSKYQGTASVTASIYLWSYNDKVVISDIDGTITKSDVMGQILPVFGRDWTQNGVADFFSKVKNNGYQFIYLSARSISQSSITKKFLRGVKQGNIALPDGPLMLSPSSLMKSFHREVIERKPEKFKIGCLRDIQKLFQENPYYAGFGNKLNDAFSYRAVGIPVGRIFTVNTKGEIRNDLINTFQSSYIKLGELVDHMFPPVEYLRLHRTDVSKAEYNDFSYWKTPILPLEVDGQLLEGVILPNDTDKKK